MQSLKLYLKLKKWLNRCILPNMLLKVVIVIRKSYPKERSKHVFSYEKANSYRTSWVTIKDSRAFNFSYLFTYINVSNPLYLAKIRFYNQILEQHTPQNSSLSTKIYIDRQQPIGTNLM